MSVRLRLPECAQSLKTLRLRTQGPRIFCEQTKQTTPVCAARVRSPAGRPTPRHGLRGHRFAQQKMDNGDGADRNEIVIGAYGRRRHGL